MCARPLVQGSRLKKALDQVTGLPALALRYRTMRPDVAAAVIIFLNGLKNVAEPGSHLQVYIDAAFQQCGWMGTWLSQFESAGPTRPGKAHSDPDIGELDDAFQMEGDRLSDFGDRASDGGAALDEDFERFSDDESPGDSSK